MEKETLEKMCKMQQSLLYMFFVVFDGLLPTVARGKQFQIASGQ